MLIESDYLYVFASREHYEPIDRFDVTGSAYIAAAERLRPADWRVIRSSIWINWLPKDVAPPAQGWKIHISATTGNAAPILTTTIRLLVRESVPFKFVGNSELLLMQNGKRWNRGGAGKFITIYPRDEEQCGHLLELLYRELLGYRGPYILSDRRYKDSGVVHYRYGGMLNYHRLDVTGKRVPVMVAPEGHYIDDERSPYFQLPPGMKDPFAREEPPADEGAPTLKNGRYTIVQAIVFSNAGGVYIATDNESGAKVLIKEARPLTNITTSGLDAVWLLKKEHRILRLVEDLRVGPRPIDFFQDWEHFYLVEEYLDGITLRVNMARYSLALRTRPSQEVAQEFYDRYCGIMARITEMLAALHDREIIFSDLSHYNVMVCTDGDVRLIDFEGAYEPGIDVPASLYTPGFAPQQALDDGFAQKDDDLYALGSLLLAGLAPMNALMALDLGCPARFLDALRRDLNVPQPIVDTILGLLSVRRGDRPRAEEVVRVLRAESVVEQPEIGTWQADTLDLDALMKDAVRYILSTADPSRDDRLFPADPVVFETNPMSIAYGACGVAYALQRITGEVPDEVREWMLRRELANELYPPGLYVGLSGIAWVLLEMGHEEQARKALALARTNHLLRRELDIFYGVAGWGLTELRFHLHDGDPRSLALAEEAARQLIDSREESEGGYFWRSLGTVSCTFAHGASGIATFLLYLHLVTGKEEYLDVAGKALAFVESKALEIADGGASWHAREEEPTYTPYWRWGSAGIGMALLRYMAVVPDGRFESLFERLTVDCDRKYSIFSGRFFGLSGIADFCVDWAQFRPHEREHAMHAAKKALSGALLFRIERPTGIAFPGDTLSRLSCDYGTGSAGVASFLHRYLNGSGPEFMLDDLLPGRRACTLSLAGATHA